MAAESTAFSISVRTLAGKIIDLEVVGTTKILEVKQKLEREHKLGEVALQKLVLGGKILANGDTIHGGGVSPGDELALTVQKVFFSSSFSSFKFFSLSLPSLQKRSTGQSWLQVLTPSPPSLAIFL